MNTPERVRGCIKLQLGAVDDIGNDDNLVTEHGLDGLELIEILMSVEEEFAIEIEELANTDIDTINKLVAVVTRILKGRESS